jgi:hypothetical protein
MMAITYVYQASIFSTEQEAQDAVLAQKVRLDNNPTDWISVKLVEGSAESGWVMPPETLTDNEINNLNLDGVYAVSSIVGGDNAMPLSAEQVSQKSVTYRAEYAMHNLVTQLLKIDDSFAVGEEGHVTVIPTVEDMSVYL